eukprot:7359689-Pyramimonas_sp.AAC.1
MAVSVAQPTPSVLTGSAAVPEARPWYEWCQKAENAVLDACKRRGKDVCNYVAHCFGFANTFASDSAVARDTTLQHVFYDGGQWWRSP